VSKNPILLHRGRYQISEIPEPGRNLDREKKDQVRREKRVEKNKIK